MRGNSRLSSGPVMIVVTTAMMTNMVNVLGQETQIEADVEHDKLH